MTSIFSQVTKSESDAESLITMKSALNVIMTVGGKKYSSDILFSVFRVHVVCVWPNTESRIIMQRWKPSAKVPNTSFSTDCVYVSLSAEAWWLYGRVLCVHLHVRMWRCGPRGGHWKHVEPGPHLPHLCSF